MANLHAVIPKQPARGTPDQQRTTGRRRILNHDISHFERSGGLAARLCSSRALALSNPDDTVQLAPELRSEWPAIVHHYDRIGLMHSHDVIWDTSYSWFDQLAGQDISVQRVNDEIQRHRDHRNWCETARYIGAKNNFIHLARELKTDVPQTWCFDHRADVADMSMFPYPCYLKASLPTVSGGGLFQCANAAALQEALKLFDARTPVQVQQQIAAESIVTLHYMVRDAMAQRVAVTERQRVNQIHHGTRFPAAHAPWSVVEPLAEWLAVVGLHGAFEFEVAVIAEGGGTRYQAISCNPWYSNSSYAALVAQQLGLERWSALRLDTRKRRLGEIDLSGIEYNDFAGAGIIVVNWGMVLTGKLDIIIAGPEQAQHQLRSELERRLS